MELLGINEFHLVGVLMSVFESSRKVQIFGTSLAITLPAMFVKANEVEKGSTMSVLHGLDSVLVVSQVKDPEALLERLMKIIDKLGEKVPEQRKGEGQND